jgi:hypothetical protein
MIVRPDADQIFIGVWKVVRFELEHFVLGFEILPQRVPVVFEVALNGSVLTRDCATLFTSIEWLDLDLEAISPDFCKQFPAGPFFDVVPARIL